MKIAICDNDKGSLDLLHELLNNVKRVVSVKEYQDVKQLQLAAECGEAFDVVMMDIDWGLDKNGIDFAAELCAVSPEIRIIFVTGYNERYSQEIFLKPLNLAGFITKPVNPEILSVLIENIWRKKQEENSRILTITHKNRRIRIRNRDIIYMESIGHRVIVHTNKEDFVCYEKLAELQKRLDPAFVICHKSFLVNMEEISRIDKDKIALLDERQIPVSKKRYDEVRKLYFRYLGESFSWDETDGEKQDLKNGQDIQYG